MFLDTQSTTILLERLRQVIGRLIAPICSMRWKQIIIFRLIGLTETKYYRKSKVHQWLLAVLLLRLMLWMFFYHRWHKLKKCLDRHFYGRRIYNDSRSDSNWSNVEYLIRVLYKDLLAQTNCKSYCKETMIEASGYCYESPLRTIQYHIRLKPMKNWKPHICIATYPNLHSGKL